MAAVTKTFSRITLLKFNVVVMSVGVKKFVFNIFGQIYYQILICEIAKCQNLFKAFKRTYSLVFLILNWFMKIALFLGDKKAA